MLFKVTNKDNKGNSVFIQGSYSRSTSNDISSVTFQNYDDDTKATYNIARIAARDAFGNSNINGFGDLLFMTNGDGSNLSERMRIKSSGYICMGTSSPIDNSLLSVNGNATVAGDLNITGNNAYFRQANVSSNLNVQRDLNVSGTTSIDKNVIVGSNLIVYENVDVFGITNLRSRLTVGNGLVVRRTSNSIPNIPNTEITLSNDLRILEDGIIQGTLDVSSNVTFSNTFLVLGNAAFRSNVDIDNNLDVGGDINITSDMVVNGNTTIHSALIVNSNAIVGKESILVGNLTTLSNVTLGSSTLWNEITMNGRTRAIGNHSNSVVVINQSGTGNLLSLQKNNTEKIVASSNGFLGIGTSTPTAPLEVVGDVHIFGDIYQNSNLLQNLPNIVSSSQIKSYSKNYRSILSWINNSASVDSLYVKSYITHKQGDDVTSSNFFYSLRVYDSTNNVTLHTSSHSNQSPSNLFLSFSNVTSSALTNIELHSKVGPIGNYVCVETVLLN